MEAEAREMQDPEIEEILNRHKEEVKNELRTLFRGRDDNSEIWVDISFARYTTQEGIDQMSPIITKMLDKWTGGMAMYPTTDVMGRLIASQIVKETMDEAQQTGGSTT